MLAGLLIAVLAALPSQLAASDAAELPWSAGFGVGVLPTVHSLKTSEAPKVDADFSDRCWKDADWASSFVEAAGRNRAQFETEVAVSHDDKSLYVAFLCHEPRTGELEVNRERLKHDDNAWQDDCVELFLSPEGSDSYFQFIANASGSRGESRDRKAEWDGNWTAEAAVLQSTWQVEMEIPFETLGSKAPGEGDVWRANFTRERRCKGPQEDSAWSPAFGSFHNTTRFGRMVFAGERSEAGKERPVLQSLRLLKPLETGVNSLELEFAPAAKGDLRVVVETSTGGRQEDLLEKEVSLEGERVCTFPMKASREGPFFASVTIFEEGRLVEQKHMSGTVARPLNAPRAHPRLYFGPDDMEALRRKMEHPLFKRDWEAIRRAAEAALEGPPVPEGRPSDVLPAAAGAAAKCAFVYRLTGEARFGERAREICTAVLAADGWTGAFLGDSGSPIQFHLGTAAICQGMALAYDMLAPDMSASERKRFAETCYEKALKVFLRECSEESNPYLSGTRTMNWLAVLSSGAGCLFIALDGDGMDFGREIEIARAHILRFVEWYDDDGCALEHGTYWTYGMGHALQLLTALKENGWPEIMQQTSRKLERVAYPILYGCIGGKHVANFCDDSYGPLQGARDNALVLAAEFQDGRLQWWAGQLPDASELGFVAGDPGLEATPPDSLPTCMVFPRTGLGVLRESMTDPDTRYLAIKAGRARGTVFDDPHCQFDLNSVVLDAFGVTLLADPGYGHDWAGTMSVTDPKHPSNSTPPHNTVLVDGRGQEVQWSPIAFLEDLSPAEDVDYIVSRIEQGYGPKVARFDRHAYFVDKRFYVLLDDIELTAPGVITWKFHGPKGSEMTADKPATIASGPAELRIIPQSTVEVACTRRDDHVLPRLQWDTVEEVKAARVAWLLLPERAGARSAPPSVELHQEFMVVSDGKKEWRLPIVRRRVPHKSSMTLIRDPGQ
jgi:hypothetical protein